MKTFDDLEVRRTGLAQGYLQLLKAQPGRPLALFAPRRVGKTFFLDHDITPAAKKAGLVPVYADLWLHKVAPLEAINHALEEALDDARVPRSPVGKFAKTQVKKIGGLGASVEFGDEPQRRDLPTEPSLRFDTLIVRLAKEAKKPVLLMLDEIQALGELSDGPAAIATLRAVLQKRKREVRSIFTGSSQEALAAMMVSAGSPMYQFAQLMNFPALGDEYLQLLADHFSRIHRGKRLDLDDLGRAFEHIGFKPALMKDIVKAMSAEGITDVDFALRQFTDDERQIVGWRAVVDSLRPIERAVLITIAQGNPPLGRVTLDNLAKVKGLNPTPAKVRGAVERLKRAGILAKSADGAYIIEDRLFGDYIAGLGLQDI